MHRRICLFALLTSSTLGLACDTGPGDEPGFEPTFRTKHNCSTVVMGTQVASFKVSGTDNPDAPEGGGDPWPFQRELHTSLVAQNYASIAEATFAMSPEGREGCTRLCTEYGLRWGGEACTADGGVEVGEFRAAEVGERRVGYEVEVHADVDLSCVCPGLDGKE